MSFHPQSIVESTLIGLRTRIWAFVHVLPGASIGSDCNICDHVFIENDVHIGDRVTIKSGVQIWDGITVEDDVFIGPNVTFTNDKFPRSKQYPDSFERTVICTGASLGANSTILPGLTIGMNSMVGAGSVVTHDIPPNAVVVGNPARIIGYTAATIQKESAAIPDPLLSTTSSITGVQLISLPSITDLRGKLTVNEVAQHIPFSIARYFLVFDVPSKEVRGEHAHIECSQFLSCIKGSCNVVLDNGTIREELVLDSPSCGLLIPPLVWGIQYKFSHDAVLLVLASHQYESTDYIRDYSAYLKYIS